MASPRPTERFGAALAFADVDGDGRVDLGVGDPGDANGCGCVRVFTEGRLDATRVCGNDDHAPVGATLRAIGATRDDGRAWVSTAATTMPDAQESYGWVIGGAPLRVRATMRPRRAHGDPLLRVTPVVEPLAPGPAEQIDAVLRRDAEALAMLRRSRPRLALSAAMIAASDARDAAALRRLDAALAAVPALDYDYLHIEGDTPLARAFVWQNSQFGE